MISYEWYRSFVAIYQTGTVSAAAERRALTQPAVSQHLAALEQVLKVKLFERLPRQMQATPQGQELYSQIIGAIEKLDQVTRFGRLPAPERLAPVRIGAPNEYFAEVGLLRLAEAHTRPYRIWLSWGTTKTLLKRLEDGELDIVIATQKLSGKRLHYLPLGREYFSLVTPPDTVWPTDSERLEDLEGWLSQQRWISYGPELPIIRRYWQEVFGKRPSLRPEAVFPDLRVVLGAVAAGLGFSILPDYLCARALATQTVRAPWHPEIKVGNQLYLVCKLERLQDPPLTWAIQALLSGENLPD